MSEFCDLFALKVASDKLLNYVRSLFLHNHDLLNSFDVNPGSSLNHQYLVQDHQVVGLRSQLKVNFFRQVSPQVLLHHD